MSENNDLSLTVEFKGGTEYLFDNVRKMMLSLSNDAPWTLKRLIDHLKVNYLKEKPELFVEKDSVRPGILVLVNDVDWELLDEENYILQDNDNVLFISTLHGG